MPALRKREQRKSRTSTPYAHSPTHSPLQGTESKKEKVQGSLDKWIEPQPQNPAPSFEEHGFARHGVLETMAPLGVRPSVKAKQSTRLLANSTGKRSLPGRNGNAFQAEDGVSTPEMTPAPEVERDDSERQEEDEDMQVVLPTQDEDEDDDYVPNKPKAKAHTAKPAVRGKTPVQSKTPVQAKTPVKNGISKPPTAQPSPAPQQTPVEDTSEANRQRVAIAVNHTISRFNQDDKRHAGAAISYLHNQSKDDPETFSMLNAVVHHKQSRSQWDLFRSFVKRKKHAFKMIMRRSQQEAGDEGDIHDSSPFFNTQPDALSPRASSEVAPNDSASVKHMPTPPKKKHVGSAAEDASVPSRSAAPEELSAAPHPLTTVPALPPTETPSPPAPRMPSKSPRKPSSKANNAADSEDAGVEASTAAPTPAAKSPNSGVHSDSDLSEVNEEIVQNGPPEPVRVNGTLKVNIAPPKKGKGAALALARASKKMKASHAKGAGKHEKKTQAVEEDPVEQERIQRRRQELADAQLSRRVSDGPISDLRFDEEINDTESLTESQIAVGPPVDTGRPRRAGRPPRNGSTAQPAAKKRARGVDARVHSPQLDSAGTSRPTTPVVAADRGPKRIKLNNGQAARTKRSPVKNRDGPIAGIPHAGGGGSRQSRADDNDPSSPPSDSDDLCAACKGTGQFVICDSCPRVFHFLCCDPPLDEAPKGAFLCNGCSAKLKSADESGESPASLGPLFKLLEHTNSRAFALPFDLQNYFEHVSARPDGSYLEDVKKFALAKSSGYGYQKPDYTKVFDADHKPILCVSCGTSSGGKRQMLKCDFCNAYWHLDCCDPPLANPPHISLDAAQRDAWMCPRHIDHDLRSRQLTQNDLNHHVRDTEMADAPAPRVSRKVRKPKHPKVVDPTFTRGIRNNGLIEVINDPDDDTDGEGNYVFNHDESKDLNSKVYRVPERGVMLDFITKVKEGRIQQKSASQQAARRKSSMQRFATRPIEQQQAALNLARLANRETDLGMNEVNVDALVLSLTAEAPKNVVNSMSATAPPPVTDHERAQLMKFKELIDRRLNG